MSSFECERENSFRKPEYKIISIRQLITPAHSDGMGQNIASSRMFKQHLPTVYRSSVKDINLSEFSLRISEQNLFHFISPRKYNSCRNDGGPAQNHYYSYTASRIICNNNNTHMIIIHWQRYTMSLFIIFVVGVTASAATAAAAADNDVDFVGCVCYRRRNVVCMSTINVIHIESSTIWKAIQTSTNANIFIRHYTITYSYNPSLCSNYTPLPLTATACCCCGLLFSLRLLLLLFAFFLFCSAEILYSIFILITHHITRTHLFIFAYVVRTSSFTWMIIIIAMNDDDVSLCFDDGIFLILSSYFPLAKITKFILFDWFLVVHIRRTQITNNCDWKRSFASTNRRNCITENSAIHRQHESASIDWLWPIDKIWLRLVSREHTHTPGHTRLHFCTWESDTHPMLKWLLLSSSSLLLIENFVFLLFLSARWVYLFYDSRRCYCLSATDILQVQRFTTRTRTLWQSYNFA